jgi:hypothetical protein
MTLKYDPVKDCYHLTMKYLAQHWRGHWIIGTKLHPFLKGITNVEVARRLRDMADAVERMTTSDAYTWERRNANADTK